MKENLLSLVRQMDADTVIVWRNEQGHLCLCSSNDTKYDMLPIYDNIKELSRAVKDDYDDLIDIMVAVTDDIDYDLSIDGVVFEKKSPICISVYLVEQSHDGFQSVCEEVETIN